MNSTAEILLVTKENALQAFKEADAAGRRLLVNLFDKKHFVSDMRELIDSFEAACEFNNTNPQASRFTQGTESGIAMEMIAEIAKALNGGKAMKGGEKRYYPWFEYASSGFRFGGARYGLADSFSGGGPRLCTEKAEHAIYMGQKFLHLYDKFLNG